MERSIIMIIGLIVILLLVLFLPFTKLVESNLEVFLFIMGVASVIVSQTFTTELLTDALLSPINITLAVLVAGLLFRWFQNTIEQAVLKISEAMPFRLFMGLFVIVLALLSSIITAIVAAIILVSVLSILHLHKKTERIVVVVACYAIGMGAALTPIGEPLSTIVTGNLNEEFFYLFKMLAIYVIPGVIAFGLLAAFVSGKSEKPTTDNHEPSEVESYTEIVVRSLKIYLFVMALTFLGAGFQPFIERFLLDLSPLILYWINMVSAVLDNATLAAAEISPAMSNLTIRDILLGLIISGGMLIPGNIPNIIAAGKLKITSMEYARIAFPIGLIVMAFYFIIILIF